MTIYTHRQREFIEAQHKQGGVVPSKLAVGTQLLIETRTYIYNMSTVQTGRGKAFLVDSGVPQLAMQGEIPDHCIRITSKYTKYNLEMDDWIGKKMTMMLIFDRGPTLWTGEVLGITVSTERYSYDLWTV